MTKRWYLLIFALLAALLLSSGAALGEENALSAPAIEIISPDATVARGELLAVNVGGAEGDVLRYHAEVLNENGEFIAGGYSTQAGSLQVPTAALVPGAYTVKACAIDRDYNEGPFCDEIPFTVTEYQGSENIVIRLGKDTALSRDFAAMSVYAPGAESVRVICAEDPDLNWDSESDFCAFNIFTDRAGTYSYTAEACYADGRVETSDTVTLTCQVLGTLGMPSMDLQDGAVPAGEDLTVNYSFTDPNVQDGAAVEYCIEVYDLETDEDSYLYRELDQSGAAVIPGSALEAGHRYEVHLYTIVKDPGYTANDEQRLIFAVAGDDRISLTVNGESEITVPTHEEVRLNIHAPGATAIHLFKGRTDDWEYWGDHNGYQEDIELNWSHWTGETVALYINVCFDSDFEDENAQWFTSDPLIIHVTAGNGTLPEPQFTLPAQVNVGDALDIEVTSVNEGVQWCYAEMHARNENGGIDWTNIANGDMDEQGHISLPTGMLQPGQTYMVRLMCGGYGWNDSPAVQRWFTAAGEEMDEAQFFLMLEETDGCYQAITSKPFTALGYVPGAEKVRVYADGDPENEWGYWESNCFSSVYMQTDRTEVTTLTLAACLQGEEEWQDIATVSVRGTAPNGEMDLSSLELSHLYSLGDSLVLNFPEYVTRYDMDIWKETLHEGEEWGWHSDGAATSVTVPGNELPEGIFHLNMNLYAPGYETAHIDNFVFSVTDSRQSDITLTAPARVQCAEEFAITVNAPGATAVSWWIPNWNERMYPGSSCEDTNAIFGKDDTVIYARAYYGEIDWDSFDDRDWQHSLDWGPISAVQTFTVTATGTAGQPEVTGVPAAVEWNDTLQIGIGAAAHAAWYDVRILERNEWHECYYEHLDGPGTVEYSTYDLTPGDYALEVYIAGETGYSENRVQIDFTLNGIGQCEAADAQLAAAGVSRGQMLEITVPEAENAVWYHARIRDNDWNEYCFVDLGGPGTYRLPTAGVPAGEGYFVIISTGAPGWYWNESNADEAARFAVTEDGAVFDVNQHEALTREDVILNVFAPGAERFRVSSYYISADEPGWWDENGWEGESWTDTTRWEYPEENITLRAEALQNGQWQLIGEQTVTVTADYNYNAEYMRSLVPAILNSGDDLAIALPEGVTGGRADVWDDTADGTWIYWMNWNGESENACNYFDVDNPDAWAAGGEGSDDPCLHEEGGRIYIPVQYLKPNHTYHMDMDMWGKGVAHEAVGGVSFTVIEPAENEITLTVNDSQDDQTLQVFENWSARVSAPGASAVRFFDGWNWQNWQADENGVWEGLCSDESVGTRARYAQACYDPIDWDTFDYDWNSLDWQGVSNVIQLTFSAAGRINAATFTLDPPAAVRGDFVALHLNGMVDGGQYHANAYWLDEENNRHWMGDEWYEHENGVIMLPTIDMEPGEWIVQVDSFGLTGYLSDSWGSSLTITEPSAASLNFSKYDVKTNERFLNAILVPGAAEITTTVNEPDGWQPDDWDNVWQFGSWEGEMTHGDALWFDRSGTYTVKLYARMSEDGGWEYTGVSRTITVTADTAYDFRSMIPLTHPAGEDLELDLSAATDTWVNVYDETLGGCHVYWMNWESGRQSDYNYYDTETDQWAHDGEDCLHSDSGNFVLPAQYLKTGHTYWTDIHAGGETVGFEAEETTGIRFIVTPGADGNVNLQVNGGSGDLDVTVNAWYTITVTAPGADGIRVYDGWRVDEREGDTYEDVRRNSGNESHLIYAQARYNGGDWGGISNAITVSSHSDLQTVAEYTIVNENAAVGMGDELVLSVTALDAEAEYNAHVKWMDENDNEQWIDGNYGLEGSTIRIPTDNLWEGDFYVRLDVFGREGYCDSCLDLPFTVVPGDAYFRVDKTEAVVMEKVIVSAYDPEAGRIRFSNLYRSDAEPNWWDENGWEGNSGLYDVSWDYGPEDGVTVRAEGWHEDIQEWVEIGSETIAVTAPNGQTGEPAIEATPYQNIHSGLWFHVDMPENASAYEVEVWENVGGDDRVWKLNNERYECNQDFALSGNLLELGHTYVVFVRTLGYGCSCYETTREVTMAEPQTAPDITVTNTTVQQGECFRVVVNNYDPEARYHAYFRVYITDGENVNVNYDTLLDMGVRYYGDEILLHTAGLEADRDYQLCVDVFDKPGYAENGTGVNVTVQPSSGNVIRLADDQIPVGTDFPVYAHADGAEEIRIVLEEPDGVNPQEWYQDGDTFTQEIWSWGIGNNFTVTAYGRFGDDWTVIGSQTLDMISWGPLDAPELTIESQILQPGEMPVITFSQVENVGWYKVSIWDDNEEMLNYDLEEAGTYTLDASWFREGMTLDPGKAYVMDISVWQPGYGASWSDQVKFAVVDPDCSVLTLNVPAALTEIEEEAFAGTPAQIVRINAAPGLNIGYRAFADSGIIVAVIPEGVNVDPCAFEGCGHVVIVPAMD